MLQGSGTFVRGLGLAWVLGIQALLAQGAAGSAVQPASAEQRVALVIGNSTYGEAPLRNPVNDARAMKEALEGCQFQVTLLTDADKRGMEDAIRGFGDRIRGGAVGLFYFAGHGVQVKGINYLVPVGARMDREDEVPYQAVEAGQVLDKMESAKNRLNILILDACRNNPFARSWRSAGDRGLAVVQAPTGSLIAYATAPGSVAADGSGSHGLYTEALLAELREPGLELEKVFKRVREKVLEDSNGQQTPWESNSTVGDFFFRPRRTAEQIAAEKAAVDAETAKVQAELARALAEQQKLQEAAGAQDAARQAELLRLKLQAQKQEQERLEREEAERKAAEAELGRARAEEAQRQAEAAKLAALKQQLAAQRSQAGPRVPSLDAARAEVATLQAKRDALVRPILADQATAVAALEEGVAARRKRLEAPRDEFETAAQYQDRVQQAKELQGQVQKEREGIEKRFGELAEVQAGPLDSRMEQLRSQPFPVSYSVELGRYDADHGWFEVQVRDERHGVFSATLPVDPALARDLRSRKDRLKGEGFLTLADGSGLPRNVVDPVLGTLPLRASSPVGHWKWGGKPGPLVADRSWTRNPARLLNGAAWAPGRVGPALKLSHAGFQYARVDTCAGLPLGHSPRTLMAWINPASLPDPTYNGVVAYGQMAPSQGSLLSVRGDGRLSMAFWWNDAWQTVGPAIPLNAWSHVAMTYDGGTGVKFFINGQLAQATSVSAGTPADTRPGPVRIGSTDDPGRTFDGMIDDVRIYDTALASAEIEAIARDLVACWDMDPGGADTLLDRSVNGNQAKLQHGAILGPGRGGRAALALAGGRQYARVANPVGLPMGNCPRTMMAWVNPSSLPDPYYNGILTYGGYCTGMGSTLSLRNNGQISVAFWCNDAWQTVGPAVPLNTWTHVAMTYDGRTGVNYFINGQLVQTDALSSGVPPNTQPGPVRIGATDDPGRTFQGSIQDVRIYATALSAAQISAVMAGAGS